METFATPHVLFLLAVQDRHSEVVKKAIDQHLPSWEGQIWSPAPECEHGPAVSPRGATERIDDDDLRLQALAYISALRRTDLTDAERKDFCDELELILFQS